MSELRLPGRLLNQLNFDHQFDSERDYNNDELFEITGGYLKRIAKNDDKLTVTYMYYDHHNEPEISALFQNGSLIKQEYNWSGTKYSRN